MNNLVEIMVTKHATYGLQVNVLHQKRAGIIHKREISWSDKELQKWRELFPVGYKTQAVILHNHKDRPLELSMRLAKKDPWDSVNEQFSVGDFTEGVVMNVKSYGAYIDLSDGLTGLIHKSRLPEWSKKDILELFWPGDRVLVQILSINLKNRRISLGITLENEIISHHLLYSGHRELIDSSEKVLHKQYILDQLKDVAPIKIVLLNYSRSKLRIISAFFQNTGHHVIGVTSTKDCIGSLTREIPDILLVDFDIPGTDGIEIINQITSRFPSVHCALSIDLLETEKYNDELDQLSKKNIPVLINPLLPEDLVEILQKLNHSQDKHRLIKNIITDSISILLEKCRQVTDFDIAVLFSLDPVRRVVEITARRGKIPDSMAIDNLIYSPVRDVAEDGEHICIEDFQKEKNQAKYDHLRSYYPFSSCLGIRVPVEQTEKYALFLFGSDPRPIYDDEVTYIQATALMIDAHLEKRVSFKQVSALQKSAQLGQITGMLTHELQFKLDFIAKKHKQVFESINIIEKNLTISGNNVESDLKLSREKLSELENMIKNMQVYINTFGSLRSFSQGQAILVKELIQETITLLKDMTIREHIHINFMYNESKMIIIRGNASQIQQVIINLLVNTIELIGATRPGWGGNIWLKVSDPETEQEKPIIKISISDDGPGIHYRIWEKIFEMGFTTRKGGSGLGLTISRGIVENMGGKLYVSESYILGGTTFIVELPYHI